MFIVQAKDSEDLGYVAVTKDELERFLAVHDGKHILSGLRCTPWYVNVLQISPWNASLNSWNRNIHGCG